MALISNNVYTITNPSISVVVPAYNSEGTLSELVARLEPVLSLLSQRFELILVNDGSRDQTWQVIKELAGQHDFVMGLDLMRNYGQRNLPAFILW